MTARFFIIQENKNLTRRNIQRFKGGDGKERIRIEEEIRWGGVGKNLCLKIYPVNHDSVTKRQILLNRRLEDFFKKCNRFCARTSCRDSTCDIINIL